MPPSPHKPMSDAEQSPATPRKHSALHGRLLSRAQALQLLFQADNSSQTLEEVLASPYVVTEGPADEFAQILAETTYLHREMLDAVLQEVSSHWDISRMALVDKNILRMALAELLFSDEIASRAEQLGIAESDATVDTEVAINEAVNLSKIFGGDQSFQFVNGILGRIVRDKAKGVDFLMAQAKNLTRLTNNPTNN